MAIKRIYVQKKAGRDVHSKKLLSDLKNILGIAAADLKIFLRYDIDGLEGENFDRATVTVFSEPPVDNVYYEQMPELEGYEIFGVEYLPGQYDQRADSAAQCVQMLTLSVRPLIATATVYAVSGVNGQQLERIKKYIVNPVEARLCSLDKPLSLTPPITEIEPVEMLEGFINYSPEAISEYHAKMGFAMSVEDLMFVQAHFASEMRNPTVTELKVIDTYWSDHCRHTTFLTYLKNVSIKSDIPQIREAYETYLMLFNKHHEGKVDKYPCLMDMATIAVRELKKQGMLDNLDESDEINACSINVTANVDGEPQDFLVMFKNETHNHPTEIEPFGGAATCLGGAIRDPLSGRVYVYQAMRVTGAGDITEPIEKTIAGKLPQRVISKTAAAGFSSYGNQIGLATGMVSEVFHEGYKAKRLETGFVVGAAPKENVVRCEPEAGDVVVLIGGETGRDGCGGATGSSKAHTVESIDRCGAEVQKGNPLTERKIQRLFRNGEVTRLIKRCNDFGAGGVSVAIGELSAGLDIDLDAVPKKYQGLSATELAISESQERMAVVVKAEDAEKIIELSQQENLAATVVAKVTDTKRMRMTFGGRLIVDLSRKFLDSNGVRQTATANIKENAPKYFDTLDKVTEQALKKKSCGDALSNLLSSLNVCSQKGLTEMFDSSIGAGSVLMPFGGESQLTPAISMAALLPVRSGVVDTATVASYGFNADLSSQSPFTGAVYAIVLSVIKAVATGAPLSSVRLTLQEFFPRLYTDPNRWGMPASALLGALYAQLQMGLGAIGGKDSMSGSFEKIDVPPTLISFALGVAKAEDIITNVLKDGMKVYRIALKRDRAGMPDFEYLDNLLRLLNGEIKRGNVKFATVVEEGGAACAVAKSCFGNGLGFTFSGCDRGLFTPMLGDILVSTSSPDSFVGYDISYIGQAKNNMKFSFSSSVVADDVNIDIVPAASQSGVEVAVKAFTNTLERVYPTVAASSGDAQTLSFNAKNIIVAKKKTAVPRVLIPVFPGTNCEYDTARRFEKAGAETEIFIVKNRTPQDIESAVDMLTRLVKKCQIIAFPGGFSGGDEPDGSGKFIATTFSNPKLSEEVMKLLNKRDGLALGICNGFQALIKLGLLPYGKIAPLTDNSPTLTFNNISRHVSTVSSIRISSSLSPWLQGVNVGDKFSVAISHGEGKLIAAPEDIDRMIKNGQIATQYVDLGGNATMQSPFNPNGSVMAIEGITSPDGRVYGKMGHSERIGKNVMKNICGETDMKIFESGVKYFM